MADLQAAAASSGAPLSVFVQAADLASVHLRVFTPTQEKGSSDSAALAALHARSPLSDLLTVVQGVGAEAQEQSAQLCGGEWLLRQGEVLAAPVAADLGPLGLTGLDAWVASTGRPNLVVALPGPAALNAFVPDDERIAAVNRATGTTGLVLYAPGGPGRVAVSFRAFGPLKGFSEDAASSNMLACLTGVLAATGQLPPDTNLLRAAQCKPGQPARLSAQFAATSSGTEVWVGGRVEQAPGSGTQAAGR
ncbi:phenazine biosynthesis PhzC/PhzF protein [Deinococcus arcticus]|uniref:Phenazine biosynthesis PhzC/PhzF protein n=1 Tax=Deinococcus arcticus TaxID=2136176 RepID=A0A2T3WDA9_9DEIO|nr:phenazine biosynthesis PhzC/PhzF protein [Deinococcus arcticus]